MRRPTIIYLEGLPALRQNQTPEEQLRRQEILRRNNHILAAMLGLVQNSALSGISILPLSQDEGINAKRSEGTKPLESSVRALGWQPCFGYVKRNFGLWQAIVWLMHTLRVKKFRTAEGRIAPGA